MRCAVLKERCFHVLMWNVGCRSGSDPGCKIDNVSKEVGSLFLSGVCAAHEIGRPIHMLSLSNLNFLRNRIDAMKVDPTRKKSLMNVFYWQASFAKDFGAGKFTTLRLRILHPVDSLGVYFGDTYL